MKKRVLLGMVAVLSSALPVSWGEGKVTICHHPPGNPTNVQIITIGESALYHHMGNHAGDRLVAGDWDSCTSDVTPPPPGSTPN